MFSPPYISRRSYSRSWWLSKISLKRWEWSKLKWLFRFSQLGHGTGSSPNRWKAQAQVRSLSTSLPPLVPKCLFIWGSWEQVGAGLGEALIFLGFLWQQPWLVHPVGHCSTWEPGAGASHSPDSSGQGSGHGSTLCFVPGSWYFHCSATGEVVKRRSKGWEVVKPPVQLW